MLLFLMRGVLFLPWQWPCGAFRICDTFSLVSFLFILDEVLLKFLYKSFSLYANDLILFPSHFFTWDLFELFAVLALYGYWRDAGCSWVGMSGSPTPGVRILFPSWGVCEECHLWCAWAAWMLPGCLRFAVHALGGHPVPSGTLAFPQKHSISLCPGNAFLWAVQRVSPGCCCHQDILYCLLKAIIGKDRPRVLDEDGKAVAAGCLQTAVCVTCVSSKLFIGSSIPTQMSNCSELSTSAVREVHFPEVSNDILKWVEEGLSSGAMEEVSVIFTVS